MRPGAPSAVNKCIPQDAVLTGRANVQALLFTAVHKISAHKGRFYSPVPLPQVTKLEDVKASGNWMYPAKMDSERNMC